MKLKLLLLGVEKLLGVAMKEDSPRADVYLPERLLGMGLILMALGTVLSFLRNPVMLLGLAVLVAGIAAVLCWRNQMVHVISEEQFTYTTMFGNTTTYSFSDIEGLKEHSDSMTLYVAGKRVHIESMAVVSQRFQEKVNQVLMAKAVPEDLRQLPEEKLVWGAFNRAAYKLSGLEQAGEGFPALPEPQRILYGLCLMEMEINNGGLCQFLVNTSPEIAASVSEWMALVGADQHKNLFDRFVADNQIDLRDLSGFRINTLAEYQELVKQHPYDAFDKAYYALLPMENTLLPFVKAHIEQL